MFKEQYDVIEHRYLMRDRAGNITETPPQMCDRVATFVSLAEPQDRIHGMEYMSKWYPIFLGKLLNMEISPNTPTWVSAGIPEFGSFACVVVDNDDSLAGISKWYTDTMYLNRYNFGIGHSLHKIRPASSPFSQSKIKTKPSLHWLYPIQELAENMSQGASGRGGANMVTIPVWHPDVLEFIDHKKYVHTGNGGKVDARQAMKQIMNSDLAPDEKKRLIDVLDSNIPLKNFNMSVVVNDKFMKAVDNDDVWEVNFSLPDHSYKFRKEYNARYIYRLICQNAWESGDPGLLFYDRINEDNVIKKVKNSIYSTNPCGEIPLHPNSVCNLWTINLVKHIDFYHRKLSLRKLEDTINIGVRMGDNLTTVNSYPKEVPEIEKSAKEERRIGLDFTGLADFLYVLGIDFASKQGISAIYDTYKFLRDTARTYSARLGKKKGNFPLYRKSDYKVSEDELEQLAKKQCPRCGSKIENHDDFIQCSNCNWAKFLYIRNMHLLTQAPTGTRSRKLGVSFGIEPQYYKWYTSNVMEGKTVYNVNRILEWYLKLEAEKTKCSFEELCVQIDQGDISMPVLDHWVEAHELTPEQHLMVQATAQRWIDQAVSKTINLPKEATVETIENIYYSAWKKRCKGITIYREGSHYKEVIGKNESCPECDSINLLKIEGCVQCMDCTWSKCSL
jgi:ribonucleoside-diphosphate reductase alpha chain